MHQIKFHKMEGAGNDFVVIDNREYNFSLDEIIAFTPKICDRKYGVGADGLLVLEKAQIADVDFTMIYRNADGSDAGMCGNGARCLALFASKNGFSTNPSFNVHHNIYSADVQNEQVSVNFPIQVQPNEFELDGMELIKANAATEHLIRFVSKDELGQEDQLVQTGQKLRNHRKVNPPGTNINFVHCNDENSISLQTYERGVQDLTLACGTGALASAIAAHYHTLDSSKKPHAEYNVYVKGGTLLAAFDFDESTNMYHHLKLTGPTHFVFEGFISV